MLMETQSGDYGSSHGGREGRTDRRTDADRRTHRRRTETPSQLCTIAADHQRDERLVDGALAPPSGQMLTYHRVEVEVLLVLKLDSL